MTNNFFVSQKTTLNTEFYGCFKFSVFACAMMEKPDYFYYVFVPIKLHRPLFIFMTVYWKYIEHCLTNILFLLFVVYMHNIYAHDDNNWPTFVMLILYTEIVNVYWLWSRSLEVNWIVHRPLISFKPQILHKCCFISFVSLF